MRALAARDSTHLLRQEAFQPAGPVAPAWVWQGLPPTQTHKWVRRVENMTKKAEKLAQSAQKRREDLEKKAAKARDVGEAALAAKRRYDGVVRGASGMRNTTLRKSDQLANQVFGRVNKTLNKA